MRRAKFVLKLFLAALFTASASLLISGLFFSREWAGLGLVLLMTSLVVASTTLNSPIFNVSVSPGSQGAQESRKVA